MRLLHIDTLEPKFFHPAARPRYAIASHRWRDGAEVTLQDLQAGYKTDSYGYRKIKSFAAFVRNHVHEVEWIWVDTCCIDKSNSQELQEAITAMYKWYEAAVVCLAWLEDINERKEMRQSVWFTRGWTLQELLAPNMVVFLAQDWSVIGHKSGEDNDLAALSIPPGPRLNHIISNITNVPEDVLAQSSLRKTYSIEEKMSWIETRTTTRPEDMSYSMLGIFEVSMPLIYEEGKLAARRRLVRTIKYAAEDAANPSVSLTPPLSTIPFSRNPDFVHRPELHQLEERIATRAKVALAGLGGIGKSQLAIEYCHGLRERSPDTWILWIDASNAARFEGSMRRFAEDAKLSPGKSLKAADVLERVHDWLCDTANGPWLVVLDNAGDPGGNQRGDDQIVQLASDYIPTCPHGSMIVTSYSRAIATKIVDGEVMTISLMSKQDSVALFRHKIGAQDTTVMKKLTDELQRLPLAIVQAAACLDTKKYSLEQFLHNFQKSDSWKAKVLETTSSKSRSKHDASISVLSIWRPLFERIDKSRQSAAKLLSLVSFFDHRSIPLHLVRSKKLSDQSYCDISDDSDHSVSDSSVKMDSPDEGDDSFHSDLAVLSDSHLISLSSEMETIEMHPLVQLAFRRWLKSRGQYYKWAVRAIDYLDSAFPPPRFENRDICRSLHPHAKMFLNVKLDKFETLQHASILYKAAEFASQEGSWKEAETLIRSARDLRKSQLSAKAKSDDTLLLTYEMLLATALGEQGKTAAAEVKVRQVLEGRERLFGTGHQLTLSSLSTLAEIQDKQGDYETAEATERQVFEISRRVLGEEHPDTLSSLRNLAKNLFRRDRYAEAEEVYLRLLRMQRNVHGNQGLDTLSCLNDLGVVVLRLDKFDEAESYSREAWESRVRVLGEEHFLTLLSLNNLASVSAKRGDHAAAEPIVRRALKGFRKALGDDHPHTILALSNLTTALVAQGKHKAAEPFGRQAIRGREKLLGEDHPLTLDMCHHLTVALRNQGEFKSDEAESFGRRAYAGRRQVLGDEHPDTLSSLRELILVLGDAGQHAAAETAGRSLVAARAKTLGEDHPDTLESRTELANALYRQGKYAAAADADRDTLARRRRVFGEDHEHTLTSCENLALDLWKLGGGEEILEEAETLARRACEGWEKVMLLLPSVADPDHRTTTTDALRARAGLVSILSDRGKLDEAEGVARDVLQGRERVVGGEHGDTLFSATVLGDCLRRRGKAAEAGLLYERAIEGYERMLGGSSSEVCRCRAVLASIREEAGAER